MFDKRQLPTLAAALLVCTTATAADYQFGYRVTGDASIKPLQVFDDGYRTYLQFPSRMSEIPSILTVHGSETRLHIPTQHGPYFVIEATAPQIQLRIRSVTAEVRLSADRLQPAKTERVTVASFGVVDPIQGGSSRTPTLAVAADPVRSSSDEQLASIPFGADESVLSRQAKAYINAELSSSRGEIAAVRIVGRDDDRYSEGKALARAKAIREAVIRHGVPESRIFVAEGAPRLGPGKKAGFVSDLVVVRSLYERPSLVAPAVDSTGYPAAAVRGAVTQIQVGLRTLLSLGVVDTARMDAFMDTLKSLVARHLNTPGPVSSSMQRTWSIEVSQGSLREGLSAWAREAGYELDWQAEVDYPVRERITAVGSFSAAAAQAVSLTRGAKVPLVHSIAGNKLVVKGN